MPSSLFLPAAAVVLAATVTAWPLVKLTDTQAKDKGAVCLDGELIAHVTLAPGRGNPKAVRQIALGNLQAGKGAVDGPAVTFRALSLGVVWSAYNLLCHRGATHRQRAKAAPCG